MGTGREEVEAEQQGLFQKLDCEGGEEDTAGETQGQGRGAAKVRGEDGKCCGLRGGAGRGWGSALEEVA